MGEHHDHDHEHGHEHDHAPIEEVADAPVEDRILETAIRELLIEKGVISADERESLDQADALREKIVAVDDFAPEEFASLAQARR